MDDKKTLTINPELFSFSNNTTRKKRAKNTSEIKIKTSAAKTKDDTLKKRSILKMIRQHQEDRYKKLFEDNSTSKNAKTTPVDNQFNKEFQEAKAFLENLTEKNKVEQNVKNHTYSRTHALLYTGYLLTRTMNAGDQRASEGYTWLGSHHMRRGK